MSLPYFYQPEIALGTVALSAEEARHAVAVRRLFKGDELILVDGQGKIGQGVITESSKRPLFCVVEVLSIHYENPLSNIEFAIAFPKGDRALIMIDMLAQLGVRRVLPLITEYDEGDYSAKFIAKCERIANGAMKQSRQSHQMVIGDIITIGDLIMHSAGAFAHPSGGKNVENMNDDFSGFKIVAIGPEAGFGKKEVAEFVASGWPAVSFGRSILRIETAAVALATLWLKG